MCGCPAVAGGARLRAAESASLTVSWRLGLHAESAPRCRLLSALFIAPPPHPPAPMGEEGGWGLSRRRELKVNVRRHNGEGPPHEEEARFSSPPHDYLHGAASTINILQRSVWRAPRRGGGLGESSRQRGFEVFPGIYREPGRPRSRLRRANTTRRPDSLSKRHVCSALSAATRSPPTLFVQPAVEDHRFPVNARN